MHAHDHCVLECDRRPCHFGHCDRFTIEQVHPEWVRVDGPSLDAMLATRRDLASGTFVDGGLLDALGDSAEENPGAGRVLRGRVSR